MDSLTGPRPTSLPGVFCQRGKLFTRNLLPGVSVYGERLLSTQRGEYREWMHSRSKLAAFLKLGGKSFPFEPDTHVLYLGAASGTTASHISDIVVDGMVYCVEISPRSFRDLVMLCDRRSNMVPILADANQPSSFDFAVGRVGVIYQDVAQRGQASIMVKNLDHFGAATGMLALKSRSEDVSRLPADSYREAEAVLRSGGLRVREVMPLDPYEKDHAMIVVERR